MQRSRRMLLVAAALALALSAVRASPSLAATRPVLDGRIVNGMWSPGGVGIVHPHCGTTPDCAAWVESGCSAALAGRDPAWTTSIEKVRHLADDSQRVFSATASFRWGVLTVELWDRDCRPIRGGLSCWTGDRGCDRRAIWIPEGAAWMTVVSSGDNVNTIWTLR